MMSILPNTRDICYPKGRHKTVTLFIGILGLLLLVGYLFGKAHPRKPLFSSYSSNSEDVILYHFFRGVTDGFYIDVGANHPTRWSDTKLFYEMGWHGINIEPLTMHCLALQMERVRDINVCAAAGSNRTEMLFYEHDDISTLKPDIARLGEKEVSQVFPRRKVPVIPLSEICQQYCSPNQTIHFLKIDVEGFEHEIIKGMDWNQWKPLVLQIESSEPWTARPMYHDWEHILLGYGYDFIYMHGLDRWYIHRDHPELKQSFRTLKAIKEQYRILHVSRKHNRIE